MCGRYAAAKDQAELVLEFEVELVVTGEPGRSVLVNPQDPPAGTPDYNMAPTKQAPVVLTRVRREHPDETPARQLRLLTWGLVPSWAKDPSIGLRMINARADTVRAAISGGGPGTGSGPGAFGRAALARRCLVPAAGWYEWQASPTVLDAKGKPRKQPFFVHRADGATCAFAGLYEFWRDPTVADADDPMAWLASFTIVTTDAEPGLDRIHDRQPLVLEPGDWARWLDPQRTDPAEVRALLTSAEPGRFAAYPVSTAVNGNREHGRHLLDPAPADTLRGVVDPMTGEIVGG